MLYSGLVSITFRSLTVEEIIDAVSRAELSAIEWGGDVHVPHGDREAAHRVARLCEDAGVETAAYGSYYRFQDVLLGEGPEFQAVLDTALELGAPLLRVWAGNRGSSETSPAERAKIVEQARNIGERVQGAGIRAAFEYHSKTLTDTNESALRLIEEIGHPAVRLLWQPPVGMETPACKSELRSVLPWLENIHCFQWEAGERTEKRPLAEGEEAWMQYLKTANDGNDRCILLEFVRDGILEQFYQDAAVLKDWLDRLN